MDVEVVPFEPKTATRAEWTRYHAYRRLRHEERDPDDPLGGDAFTETWLQRDDPDEESLRFAAIDPGDPPRQVGELWFGFPRPTSPTYKENPTLAWVGLAVLAPERRRGVGRALLAKVVELARARGKAILAGYSSEDDGKSVMERIGAKVVSHRRESRLRLDEVDWGMVESWAAEGPTRSPASRLRWFRNRIDGDVLPAYLEAYNHVFNEQPFDEMSLRQVGFTPESFKEKEERVAALRGTWLTAATQEADGRFSALTEVGYFPDIDTLAWQWLTGVVRDYRGHGLGKWVKAAMLLRVREDLPHVRAIGTGNASSNAAMLSINERLGFRPHKHGVMGEIATDALEAFVRGPHGDAREAEAAPGKV